MHLAAFILVFPTLIVDTCLAGLSIESSDPDRSRLVETSIDILESCYANQIGTVGLAGASVGSIIEAISSRDTVIPVALIDETSRLANHDPVDRASRYKLQVFVVTVTDPSILAKTLIQIKNTKWWNHMASFILIASPETGNGCSNAYEILWEAWKMDLLNSKFLCLGRTRERLIYTFNPYTSKAPVPWQQENTYRGINDHVWTLFVRVYREDASRCDALDFDKTSDLGGYEVRASVTGMTPGEFANTSKTPRMIDQVQTVTSQILMDSLNATWNLLIHPLNGGPPRDENGIPHGFAAEVINGSSDIAFNISFKNVWTEYETTRTNFYSTLGVLTQYPGHKSQLHKLISVLDKSSRFGIFVVLLITLLFFKCYVRQPVVSAIMNIVLMICNAALSKIPKNFAGRIYLSSLLMLVVTIQGIYQGKFASVLTKQERLPTIDSFDDLAGSDHTIYGLDYWRSVFKQTVFEGRWVEVRKYNCTDYVLRNSEAACVYEKITLVNDASKFGLHLSEKPLGTLYGIYLVRPDWPLRDRVDAIFLRATETDVVRPMYARELDGFMRKIKSYQIQNQNQTHEPLTLKQLSFAFAILAIGLGCAAITYIIELSIYGTRVAKPRRRIRRRFAFVV